jgi:RHS repeat-associated protein
VYDNLDRHVLTQDAIQKIQRQWLFTKYDALGRVVYTGIYTHTSSSTQDQMQRHFNTENNTAVTYYETKQTSASSLGIYYSSTNFPASNLEVLTVNYYDTYVDLPTGFTVPTSVYNEQVTSNTKGLPTVSKVKVLETNSWITTLTYYDEKARPVYVYSKNDYLGTIDIIENKLDFIGKVLENRSTHKKTGKIDLVTIDTFIYDHADRLLTQNQCVGDSTLTSCNDASNSSDAIFSKELDAQTPQTFVDNNSITLLPGFHVVAPITEEFVRFSIAEKSSEQLVSNTYDGLGQLKSKKVGNKQSAPLQIVDYSYNVRGWLKNINQDANADNDLFNFSLNYNNPTTGTALFNGNISQTSWNTLNIDKNIKNYTYRYDALNRITRATGTNGRYNLQNVSYDKNGNILALQRNGHVNDQATSFGLMDDLTYSYDSGNKLVKVADAATTDQFGFKDDAINTTADISNDYTYDVNGNMKSDANKGITNSTYNYLNLPKRVTIGGQHINYTYDAVGTKLRKVVSGITTDYAGNYVYKNNVLQFFNHPEGYTKVDVTSSGVEMSYVYQYKDHLGNVRLSYADTDNNGIIAQSEIIEESNYYPFGLKHKGYNNVVTSKGNSTAQKFGFGGKELNQELGIEWMDFGARNYDAALGRWMNLDPLAEQMRRYSPYNYAFNNPIYFVDPDGMAPMDWIKNIKTGEVTWYDAEGDRAIRKAAIKDGNITSLTTSTESVKGKYKNLGGAFFGTKGDTPMDTSQMNEQQDAYLTEVSDKLNAKAGVDYSSDKLGNGMHGDVTKNTLKAEFMGAKTNSGDNNSKKGSLVGNFVKGEIKGKITGKIMKKTFGVAEKSTGVISMIMTTTPAGSGSTKSSHTKYNAIKAFQTKVKPLLGIGTIIQISGHKF